ncbi:glycoside hydrolase superfamily [Lophiotrema nucula]|uniref:chitinase n=1 Tax=Lophiotrema nucula TaxID=690887 RepID=A0A6A5Z3X4_9PLEO|nr:glycoside hydrolase superfamily [Lophiotrema nucula]
MHLPSLAFLAPLLLGTSVQGRFLLYSDEWHPDIPTNAADVAGVDHVILAFAPAAGGEFKSATRIPDIKAKFPNAKIMAAIGGWGDDTFSQQVTSDAAITGFVSRIVQLIQTNKLDGIDIDWEYPGGNGEDYKVHPNSEKTGEIKAFPKLLKATYTAIKALGQDKLLSIATPGKKTDMIAYLPETAADIYNNVDYVNIMAYDLMNRRDKVTNHHTSVVDVNNTVWNYLDLGFPPEKLNLGFAYYAKYFTTKGDCSKQPLGCEIVEAENPVTGNDTHTSGAFTFEKKNMQPVDMSKVTPSYSGMCGLNTQTGALESCPAGSCCSESNYCGNSEAHCSAGCQHAFSTGCTGPDVAGSWQAAAKNGVVDEVKGGKYYFDPKEKLFWTWEDKDLIARKFADIVDTLGLGGVFAWSLGEDSNDWSHITTMSAQVAKLSSTSPKLSSVALSTGGENLTQNEASVKGDSSTVLLGDADMAQPAEKEQEPADQYYDDDQATEGGDDATYSGEYDDGSYTGEEQDDADSEWVWYKG